MPADFLAIAQRLQPDLAAAARGVHDKGSAQEPIRRLIESGLSRLARPAAQDGSGDDWSIYARVTRTLARSCASTARLAASIGEANRLVSRLSAAAQAEVWAKEAVAVVTDWAPIEISENGGSVRMSGTWAFVAGAAAAQWIVLRGLSARGRTSVVVPVNALGIVPTAHLGGLRGSGFARVEARDIAVPAERVGIDSSARDLALDRAAPLGTILGCAEGGYADYVTMTRKRVSGTGGGPVARLTQVQVRLASVEADLEHAAHLFEAILARLASSVDDDALVALARDGAVLAQRGLNGVTQLVRQMGALGLAEFNPVQRHYRDIRTLAADPRVDWDSCLAPYGRRVLGVSEDAADAPIAAA